MKKTLLILTLILLVIVGYLLFTHHYIYRGIGLAHLPDVDISHNYMIGNKIDNKIIYAVLGDSLTAGVGADRYIDSFPYLIAKDFTQAGVGVNLQVFAYPGARSENLINDLLEPAIKSQPQLVTILIGTNDMHGFISLNKFKKNYQYVIDQLKTRTKAKIFLISVPFIGSDALILEPWRYYFNQETIKYNQVIKELADTNGVGYVDIATPTATKFKTSGSHYSVDNFHPSAEGYALWSKIIYDKINQ